MPKLHPSVSEIRGRGVSHASQGRAEAGAEVQAFPRERLSDADLVSAACHGDGRAISVVWDRYAAKVRGLLRTVVGRDEALVEDLLQETFVAFFGAAST